MQRVITKLSWVFILLTGVLFHCELFSQSSGKSIQVGPQIDGSILVPSNQLLRPTGRQILFPGRPVDLVLAAQGRIMVAMNRSSLEVVNVSEGRIIQTLPLPGAGCSFKGLALSPDGKKIFVSDSRKSVHVAAIGENLKLSWMDKINFPDPDVGGHAVPGGLVPDPELGLLYVPLSRSNTLAIADLEDKSSVEIPVGIAPFAALGYSKNKVYVSNWGGRVPEKGEPTFNTSGSQVLVDPVTGIANNGTVSVVDPVNKKRLYDIEVGLHPGAMVLHPSKTFLYVACANSDMISVIDTKTDEVIDNISVRLSSELPFGSSPNALSISADGKRLYVANGTDNAICVIETGATNRVSGFIPTAWYPGAVVLDERAGLLLVANIKGIGSRNQDPAKGGLNSHDHLGSISIIPIPDQQELEKMTRTVADNNSFVQRMTAENSPLPKQDQVPVPQLPDQKSVFRHVIYIIKENRTYDQVFGDMPQGNGDPKLVHFGREVTPNHHKLAEDFVLLDNYYCSGILSADGHQWTDEAFVTDYIERFFGGFSRSYPYDGNDALAYASSGFIWDNVLRNGLTFRNYGEFVKAEIDPPGASFTEIYEDYMQQTGKISIRARANLEQLEPYLCPTFVGFPCTVPDIYRVDEFIKELQEYEKNGDFPNFVIMLLPNDHTSGTSPGRPTPQAAVADNDLALGRLVEAVSHSKFWKETCIFVTEDDPQAGLDHVDGHRTVGMVISPYTKRKQVVSTYYSQISMVRTMENILGIPPMNQFDMAAEPMMDCFTGNPDFSPYKALPNNIPLDQLNPPLVALSGDKLYWAKKSLEQDLDDVDRIDEDTFNRILWHAVKGYDVPYPVKRNEDKED